MDLEFRGITKRFEGVEALVDVSFRHGSGRVLGLIGENGAGKSTLMNILGGVVQPDEGTMFLGRSTYAPEGPSDAERAGIAFIHQELNLFPNLSVADNLFISRFPAAGPLIRRREMIALARDRLARVELDVDPRTAVETLSPGERQLVEIARALGTDAGMIIFDEPTTSLTSRESARLFDLIRRLRAQGTTIVYISHELDDVQALSDEIAVLRDGRLVETGPAAEFDLDRMILAMVGRSLEQIFPERTHVPSSEPLLRAEGIGQSGVVEGISFTLHRGEILGLFGLMGSGRTELARMLFGLDPHSGGSLHLRDRAIQHLSPRGRVHEGMAFVTEDRRHEGLLMEAAVVDNLSLSSLRSFARTKLALIDRSRLQEAAIRVGDDVRLKAASQEQPVKTLSGGNQQKTVLGKWLLTKPDVLILDEPTRGIDVGAKYEVYTIMRNLAASGSGILCISSEIEELIGVCDRMLVMSHGCIAASFTREQFEQEAILRAAFGEQDA